MRRLHTHGQYAPDGKERRLKVREEAGHRCIRCHHPFETGKHGRGEWTPCDRQCNHLGPVRYERGATVVDIVMPAGLHVEAGSEVEAQWRILTVHHLDGNKANDAWYNTLALCQRCHLTVQCRVDPNVPFFLPHSDWAKVYIAGFYAHKYEGKLITREEATARMAELLAYELRAA
jgi:hypothetical protein